MTYGNIGLLTEGVRLLNKPLVVFIAGAPATGNSSTAIQLAAKLGIRVAVGTDQIRDILRHYIADPFLQGPIHNRWQLIGSRTPENIIEGYLRQCRLVKPAVLAALELSKRRGENMIFEGVHLCPTLYSELRSDSELAFFQFLLRVEDEKLHRLIGRFKVYQRHSKDKEWSNEKLADMREIQKFLVAKKPFYAHLVDSVNAEKNTEAILKILEEYIWY